MQNKKDVAVVIFSLCSDYIYNSLLLFGFVEQIEELAIIGYYCMEENLL